MALARPVETIQTADSCPLFPRMISYLWLDYDYFGHCVIRCIARSLSTTRVMVSVSRLSPIVCTVYRL